MITNKLSSGLQLALRYEPLLDPEFKSVFITDADAGLWELILEYSGSLDEIKQDFLVEARALKGGFAQIIVPKTLIGALTDLSQVIFLSLPQLYRYIDIGLGYSCASSVGTPSSTFAVTGQGVLLAVIDSGITYDHPDFIDDNGETRIRYLWDQTVEGESTNDPLTNGWGRVFTREQINEALKAATPEERQRLVPSKDMLGHGTALAGVAAGNGRGSTNRQNRGMAPECELLIVKVGTVGAKDISLMAGIDFCIERAETLGMPLTILLGVGTNITAHDGTAVLERYIAERYNSWICNFVVGTGNEGNRGTHTNGVLQEGQTQAVELFLEGNTVSYACCIWKSFIDQLTLTIEAPNGEKTDALSILTPNRAYVFQNTAVLINFSQPVTNRDNQEILILFQGQGGENIDQGVWRFKIEGTSILQGGYQMWASIMPERTDRSGFLSATLMRTLTSPATTSSITSVGAYNGKTFQLAPFSGKGFTTDERVKPDLVASGVDVLVPTNNLEVLYTRLSGTSLSAAFVAGAYVLMMAYGILQLGNINAYGDILRIYLLTGAKRPSAQAPFPNASWGDCVKLVLG